MILKDAKNNYKRNGSAIMTEKRFIVADRWIKDNCIGAWLNIDFNTITDANLCCDLLNQIEKEKRDNGKIANKLLEENEQLKEGMIGVVDRYIKNVDCNPPSSAHTYMKIKGALLNVREDLRDLLEDLE